jgi:hypothetical protein
MAGGVRNPATKGPVLPPRVSCDRTMMIACRSRVGQADEVLRGRPISTLILGNLDLDLGDWIRGCFNDCYWAIR